MLCACCYRTPLKVYSRRGCGRILYSARAAVAESCRRCCLNSAESAAHRISTVQFAPQAHRASLVGLAAAMNPATAPAAHTARLDEQPFSTRSDLGGGHTVRESAPTPYFECEAARGITKETYAGFISVLRIHDERSACGRYTSADLRTNREVKGICAETQGRQRKKRGCATSAHYPNQARPAPHRCIRAEPTHARARERRISGAWTVCGNQRNLKSAAA